MNIFILFILAILSTQKALADGQSCPSVGPTQSHVRAEVTLSGWDYLMHWGARQGLAAVEQNVSEIPIEDHTQSPKAENCTPEKMKTLSQEDLWKQCYGFPKCWVDNKY